MPRHDVGTRMLVPIGIPVGNLTISPDAAEVIGVIRLAGNVIQIPAGALELWMQCRKKVNESDLRKWAFTNDIRGVVQIIARLQEHELLAPWPIPSNGHLLLKKYRLVPQGLGLGNRPDRPEAYRIAIGDEAIYLDMALFMCWSASNYAESLFAAASATAQDLRLDQERVMRHLYDNVPQLLALNLGFLDFAAR
jgi:hypothetical protein